MKKKLLIALVLISITFCNDRVEKESNIIEITETNVFLNKWEIPKNPTLSDFSSKFTLKKSDEMKNDNLNIYLENGLEIHKSETTDRIEGFKINYDMENKSNKSIYLGSVKIQNVEISKFTNPVNIINYFECRGIFCRTEFGNTRIFITMNIDKTKINSLQIYF
ncbi:hypothetical protein EHQ68_16730 [Leptospira congkakensis]|uniref:Uncharacterized protein n=1 Tax=Leptospira congkakensis TaxID=2484932 RepID=A0A8B5NQS2_9LEPT|nr:hypothetical protein [Leptospira congkakensis]TGL85757.1 hypothetical protein EHQ68_16730 [Leptospira congkakensis]TGL97056.1 hypothetical protein EHQ69_00070 [Leptospira congkakensis]